MTYFNYLPKINYTFPDGTSKTVVDIYKRGHIKEQDGIFDKILIKGGQKPERLANNLYEDPNLFWQILYANNVISRNDWGLTDIEISDLFANYYKGFSFHVIAKPELTLRRGDIITVATSGVPVSPTEWAIVDTYEPITRKINSLYFTDDFFTSLEGSEIFIWRLRNENVDGDFSDKMVQIFSSSNIDSTFIAKKISSIEASLQQFKNTSVEQVISPYRETDGTTLIDTWEFEFTSESTTLITKYINGNELPNNISTINVRDYLVNNEIQKRGVFVPKKTITANITDAFRIVLSSTNALSTYGSLTSVS